MHNAEYGTFKHGRLTYRTAEEARGAAADLGLSDVHSHRVDGEVVFMPGASHEELNAALDRRGLPPVEEPGARGMSSGFGFDIDLGNGGDGGFL